MASIAELKQWWAKFGSTTGTPKIKTQVFSGTEEITSTSGALDVNVTGTSGTSSQNIAQVNGQTVNVGTGAAGTGTLRVTTSTDSTIGTLTSGNVGGFTTVVSSTITMSVAGAYATGEYMGTSTSPQSFASVVRTSGGTGIIKSIFISDKIVTANVAMELWLFSATFTAPTDNATFAISDTEALTVLGVIPIGTSGWYASSNNQVYFDGNLSIPIKPAATSLFYALVARGTTPAFTSADLTIGLGILQD